MRTVAHACRQASPPPLCKCGMPGITYGHAIHASQTRLNKINCFTFWHPKYKNCKPEHAKKTILIDMHNENKLIAMRTSRYVQRNP